MASPTETTPFGASIVPASQRPHHEHTTLQQSPPTLDTPDLTPVASHDDMNAEYTSEKAGEIPVHSPFYQHPPVSFERISSRQNSKANITLYEKDLEQGEGGGGGGAGLLATPLTLADDENPFAKTRTNPDANPECKMWPSRQTLMRQRTEDKRKRWDGKLLGPVREWWTGFDKRQQLYMKLAIALLLVGVAVAIGVGISKAVHGTYYSGQHGQQQVGGHAS